MIVRHATLGRVSATTCVALLLTPLPSQGPSPEPVDPPAAVTIAPSDAAARALRGGRGPEHCALSIGIFLGGAMGFWVNPFLGAQAMRLGLMASALHCN